MATKNKKRKLQAAQEAEPKGYVLFLDGEPWENRSGEQTIYPTVDDARQAAENEAAENDPDSSTTFSIHPVGGAVVTGTVQASIEWDDA